MCNPRYKAWHAGYSYLRGFGANVNDFSIGVEIEGPPSKLGDKWWYKSAMTTVGKIVEMLEADGIKLKGIVDHSTISPVRKVDVLDPKHVKDKFPWKQLVEATGLPDLSTDVNRKYALEYLVMKKLI
jgi:N-acetyl-anhydromuramyl-L-alanine amidase AmpD